MRITQCFNPIETFIRSFLSQCFHALYTCLHINGPFDWDALVDEHDVIGTGKYGQVCLYRRTDGTHCVVKTQTVHTRFEQEAKCLSMCNHPNIVPFLAHRIIGDDSQLAMARCPGVELYEYIVSQEDDIPLNTAQHIVRQLLSTIAYLHEIHIMHRDIKPENIVFDSQTNQITLIDFGFARTFENEHSIHMTCMGTAYYMAYEVVRHRRYTCKIDEWAAGVILFILLYRYPPFFGDSDDDIYQRVLKKTIPFPNDVRSNQASHCVTCLLHCNPAVRYSAKQCLKLAWFEDSSAPTISHVLWRTHLSLFYVIYASHLFIYHIDNL